MRLLPRRKEPVSREPLPGQPIPSREEGIAPVEKETLCQAWEALSRQKPELYLVLDARRREWNLRKGESKYNHRVTRGFYVRIAKRLGIEPQTVCYRLKAGMEWLADWLKQNGQREET